MIRKATNAGLALLILLVGIAVAAPALMNVMSSQSTAQAATQRETAAPAPKSAPTTAKGYQDMFNALDSREWGAGDVTISTALADGRVVWAFGDTFSKRHGMVNSTAIVQTGGNLHVSHGGSQMLPEGGTDAKGRKVVYWPEAIRTVGPNTVEVTAGRVWTQSTTGWGRLDVQDRTALLSVSPEGNVTFVRWTGWTARPQMDERFLTVKDGAPYQKAGHLFYGRQSHPEARMASGKALTTVNQNRAKAARTATGGIDFAQYRPIFSEK